MYVDSLCLLYIVYIHILLGAPGPVPQQYVPSATLYFHQTVMISVMLQKYVLLSIDLETPSYTHVNQKRGNLSNKEIIEKKDSPLVNCQKWHFAQSRNAFYRRGERPEGKKVWHARTLLYTRPFEKNAQTVVRQGDRSRVCQRLPVVGGASPDL